MSLSLTDLEIARRAGKDVSARTMLVARQLSDELEAKKDVLAAICAHLRRKDKSLPTPEEVRDRLAKYHADLQTCTKQVQRLQALCAEMLAHMPKPAAPEEERRLEDYRLRLKDTGPAGVESYDVTVHARARQLRVGMRVVKPSMDRMAVASKLPRILTVARTLATQRKMLCWWAELGDQCHSYPLDRSMRVVLNGASVIELDARYQRLFKNLQPGQVCPPCPRCGGLVAPIDMHVITGAECTVCKWSMIEGTGCLA